MYTPRGTKKHLFDIQQSIRSIVTYTQDLDENAYLANQMVQAAVERKFEIIGEALNRLSRDDDDVLAEIRDYQRIIGFRNILAHGYDAIDQHLVWDAVQNHLTPLSEDVERLMSS